MSITYSEYNSDSRGGTYERFQHVARHRSAFHQSVSATPLFISQDTLASFTSGLFSELESNLIRGLSARAIERLQQPGRWKEISVSALICEILTDSLVRRGPLSDVGRQQRCDQIRCAVAMGRVEFAILLLPFRTPSPLKHRGVLPDMGEIYTLVLLQAIAKACEHAQESMLEKVQLALASLTDVQVRSFDQTIGRARRSAKFDLNDIMNRAFTIVDAEGGDSSEAAVRRQQIRNTLFNLRSVNVLHGASFAELLATLSKWSLSLEAFSAFRNATVSPVTILAIQDASRYPCFSDLDRTAVSQYRRVLLDMMKLLKIGRPYLELVDYSDVAECANRNAKQKRDDFYANRVEALRIAVSGDMKRLLSCCGKHEFMQFLSSTEVDGVVEPLFEPLLFSIQHPAIGEYALKHDCDQEDIFFRVMEGIYEPQSDSELEGLRKCVIAETLEAAYRYCAAYEANTRSKNPDGFDDISNRFPNALRMSIHQKDESIGHFSVVVSPTSTRTPWHGTAALSDDKRSPCLDLSIDLAGHLECVRHYRPVFVEATSATESQGVFDRHAHSRQPIFYLSSGLWPAKVEKAHDAFWSALASRGLRDPTKFKRRIVHSHPHCEE